MVIKYTTSFQIYDDDTGKVHRQGSILVHADGDSTSMEYIKNMVATMDCGVSAIIEDTEF